MPLNEHDDRFGLSCPKCGHNTSDCKDSRPSIGTIRRRRLCQRCKEKFTTYEIVMPSAVELATIPSKMDQWQEQLAVLTKEMAWLQQMLEQVGRAVEVNNHRQQRNPYERG